MTEQEPTEPTNAEAFAEKCTHVAMHNFREDGMLVTLALIPTEEATLFVPMQDFVDRFGPEGGKMAFGNAVRGILNDGDGADMVCLISETWAAQLDMNEIDEGVSSEEYVSSLYEQYGPSMEDWPAKLRGEQIMVSVETRAGEQVCYMVEINGQNRDLGVPVPIPAGATGRFTNWFDAEPPSPFIEIPKKEWN